MLKLHLDRQCACCSKIGTYCRDYCKSCYNRFLKYGDPTPRMSFERPSPEQRFWKFVDQPDAKSNCWVWRGARGRKGYGHFSSHGAFPSKMAHRVAWLLLVGPIEEGLQLDHLCLNKACVNPDHLEPVTNQENMRRAVEVRSSCRRGHPYDQVNTFYETSGKRGCRICREAARQSFHQRNPDYYRRGRDVVIRSTDTNGPAKRTGQLPDMEPYSTEGLTNGTNKARWQLCKKELHPLSGPNLMITKEGRRACRQCNADRQWIRDQKKRGIENPDPSRRLRYRGMMPVVIS